MKLRPADRRSRFHQRLRQSGLQPGQIQHIETLYNRGDYRGAAKYMSEHNVSEYKRRTTREARKKREDITQEAREAKRRKLGTDRFMEHATPGELRQMIDLTRNELRDLARGQRPHNPFWYHSQRRSYTERMLSAA